MNRMTPFEIALAHKNAIDREREHQFEKWGQQDHHPYKWLAILMEEVGEFSNDALEFGSCDISDEERLASFAVGMLDEAVQVAAVAQQIVEALTRGNWLNDQAPHTQNEIVRRLHARLRELAVKGRSE